MPPKFRFTRQEVIDAALAVTCESGLSSLTARTLAARLGASSKTIFGLFENMEEVQSEVRRAAGELYRTYIREDTASGRYPPYKASGMAYIRFARERRELFRLLFMCDRTDEDVSRPTKELTDAVAVLRQATGLGEEDALRFHLETWIFVHGIATMIATGYLNWDEALVSRMLTDEFEGLKSRYCKGGK